MDNSHKYNDNILSTKGAKGRAGTERPSHSVVLHVLDRYLYFLKYKNSKKLYNTKYILLFFYGIKNSLPAATVGRASACEICCDVRITVSIIKMAARDS